MLRVTGRSPLQTLLLAVVILLSASVWSAWSQVIIEKAGGGAPTNATYITQTTNATLTAEQALNSLTANRLLRNTTGGVLADALLSDNATNVTLASGKFILPAATSTVPSLDVGSDSGMGFYGGNTYLYDQGTRYWLVGGGVGLQGRSGDRVRWSSTTDAGGTADLGIGRNAAGVLEVNNASAGTYRDLILQRLRSSQTTVPTCTTNCGTSPSISGSDTSMIVTLGTGSPASPVTVTFNGTWGAAPACVAANRTTAGNNVNRVDTTTTTAVIYFASGPSASDLVAVHCIGVS